MTFFSNEPYFRTTRPKNGEVKIPIDLAWTNICSIKTQFELLRQCPSGGGVGQVCGQLQAQSYQTLPEEECTEEQLVVEYNTIKNLSYERIAVEEYEDMEKEDCDGEGTVWAILENK